MANEGMIISMIRAEHARTGIIMSAMRAEIIMKIRLAKALFNEGSKSLAD